LDNDNGELMSNSLTHLKAPAMIGLVFVLPLMLLELVNRPSLGQAFPWPLFGVLWLLPVAFFLTLLPIVQRARAGEAITARPLGLLLSGAVLILVTALWLAIIQDQMPCFLGAANCD
jgi:hypothetical protein